jgi:hypothetical protein
MVVQWPWRTPSTCTLVRYDAAARCVTGDDGWGDTRTFRIGEVWLNPPRRRRKRVRVQAALVGTGAMLGAFSTPPSLRRCCAE